jgi:hypothetical protein
MKRENIFTASYFCVKSYFVKLLDIEKFFCGARVWTQDFAQVLYCLGHPPALLAVVIFEIGSHICAKAGLDHSPPDYTSQLGWQACTTMSSCWYCSFKVKMMPIWETDLISDPTSLAYQRRNLGQEPNSPHLLMLLIILLLYQLSFDLFWA